MNILLVGAITMMVSVIMYAIPRSVVDWLWQYWAWPDVNQAWSTAVTVSLWAMIISAEFTLLHSIRAVWLYLSCGRTVHGPQ